MSRPAVRWGAAPWALAWAVLGAAPAFAQASADAAPTRVVLVDEILAAVNDAALTAAAVEREARLRLFEQGGRWDGPLDAAYLSRVLDDMIARELLRQDMLRLQPAAVVVDAAATDRQMERFYAARPDAEQNRRRLARMGVSDGGLAARLTRSQRLDRFVEDRLGLMARVDEVEVEQRAAQEAPDGFETPDERRARVDIVRRQLLDAARREALRRWIADLAERGRVVQLAEAAPAPALDDAEP